MPFNTEDLSTWTTLWMSVWTFLRVSEASLRHTVIDLLRLRVGFSAPEGLFSHFDRFCYYINDIFTVCPYHDWQHPDNSRVFEILLIVLAVRVFINFVVAVVVRLGIGIFHLIRGYQRRISPTLEEALSDVRDRAPYKNFSSQPHLLDEWEHHIAVLAISLTVHPPRLPGTNLTSADLNSPLSLFLPPHLSSSQTNNDEDSRLSFIGRIHPPTSSRRAAAKSIYTLQLSPHLSINLVAKRGSQLFSSPGRPCPFVGRQTLLIRDVVPYTSKQPNERMELVFDGLSSVGFFVPEVAEGEDEGEREEDAWAEAVRFNSQLDLLDCLMRYEML